VQWIASALQNSAGDPEGENENEGAGGGLEEVREYVVERGRKSLWKSFEERHALRVVHVVCEFRGWQKSTIRDVIDIERQGGSAMDEI
jgi:hypothetical protein